ncbi:MAG: hypothetical protein IPK07_24535 [Deltaproteobacteria bacterium]|nr:hypothetical protein [Deltaproteobacteria bacterium]
MPSRASQRRRHRHPGELRGPPRYELDTQRFYASGYPAYEPRYSWSAGSWIVPTAIAAAATWALWTHSYHYDYPRYWDDDWYGYPSGLGLGMDDDHQLMAAATAGSMVTATAITAASRRPTVHPPAAAASPAADTYRPTPISVADERGARPTSRHLSSARLAVTVARRPTARSAGPRA